MEYTRTDRQTGQVYPVTDEVLRKKLTKIQYKMLVTYGTPAMTSGYLYRAKLIQKG